MTEKPQILVVDDEKSVRESLRLLLKDRYQVLLAASGPEALQIIKKYPVDLVLLDILMPEIDGLEVLKLIKKVDDSIEVMMVTAVVTVGKAVEAIRHGAYDYVTKPFDVHLISEQIAKIIDKRALNRENFSLRRLLESEYQYEKIVGKSAAIREIFKTVEDVARSGATVLITGESGTGKELVARAIHNRSARRDKLFIALNCAAIPENLLESELFGHEKGSFTGAVERQLGKFELAGGGTIFLDEIGSLPLPLQAKLLRAIQEREIERVGGGRPIPIDVRIVAATNSDLPAEIKNKKFREDLYYRLNVIPIHLPPLRERREDIPLLASHFLRKYNHEFGKKLKGFAPDVMPLLQKYSWPGNVRELENLVERLVVLTRDGLIGTEKLPPEIRRNKTNCIPVPAEKGLFKAVNKFEAELVRQAIEKADGKKNKAADLLGVHRNTLLNLRKKHRV